jgi:hypothetical protein
MWPMSLPDSFVVELPGAFPPGATTHSRTLEFTINSPTSAGVFEFNLFGERFEVADSVPAVPPDSTPSWFSHDSSWTFDGVLKRVLLVQFKPGTSTTAKQAAVDSVGGVIVGGALWPSGTEGYYFVHVSDRATTALLLAAAQALNRQAAVGYAAFQSRLKPLRVTPIGNEWSYQQRFAQYNTISGDSEVWSIPWAGGAAQLLWTRPGHTVGWIGLSESPSIGMHEAVVGIGQIDQAAAPLFVGGYTTCNVEYVNALTGASIRSRTAPPVTCFQGQIEVGTIAPVRAAANQRRRN